jgi:hypothetical protein
MRLPFSLLHFRDNHQKVLFLFFTATLLVGLFTFRQYGISWDEPVQRQLGLATWDYVTGQRDTLHEMINRYHNPAFELLEILPEKAAGLKEYRSIYYSRHLLNFLVFWIGTIFFYLLSRRILKSRWLALLAVAILYFTPRIYAHSFYNSKDIPLLVFFVISSWCAVRFIDNPSLKSAVWLAITSGFLFGIRIIGVLVPVLVVLFFLLNIFSKNISARQLKYLGFYLLLYLLAAYLFYPVIWSCTFENLGNAFALMSHFPYDDPVLFLGRFIKPQEIPWYYVPVWMAITIPVCWLVLFLAGTVLLTRKTIFAPSKWKTDWPIIYVMAWCVVPWLLVIVMHSPLYDEWRHLYFIYPAFIIIGVYFIKWLFSYDEEQRLWRNVFQFVLVCAISFQFISTGIFQLSNHPFGFAYFNFFAGKNVSMNFDLDYWGLSYRQAFDYLLNHEAGTLKVEWQNSPGAFNYDLYDAEIRKRLIHVPYDSCEYFLTNHRFHTSYPEFQQKIDSIKVGAAEIMTIYKGPPHH